MLVGVDLSFLKIIDGTSIRCAIVFVPEMRQNQGQSHGLAKNVAQWRIINCKLYYAEYVEHGGYYG
jgi:hypothetical protein